MRGSSPPRSRVSDSVSLVDDSLPAGLPEAGAPYDDRLARMLLIPLATILAALVITFFVMFQSVEVVGPSMEPTLRQGDHLLVTRGYESPLRGDIIVFDSSIGDGEGVVKRVIAVAGDTISVEGETAIVLGVPESEEGLELGGKPVRLGPLTVPEGTVFVMGDNRAVSLDSRYIGPVPLRDVRGRAVGVFTPLTRIRRLGTKPGP